MAAQDLYVMEESPSRPGQYLYQGRWMPYETKQHTIHIRGEAPRTIQTRRTVIGPVVSDAEANVLALFGNFSEVAYYPLTMSLQWTAIDPRVPGTTLRAILDMNFARNITELRRACSHFTTPSMNLMFAEASGNVAYQVRT